MGASGSKFKEQVAKKTKEDREKAFREEEEALVVNDDTAIGAIGEKKDGVLLVHTDECLDENITIMILRCCY
jgi:hypothetical protein